MKKSQDTKQKKKPDDTSGVHVDEFIKIRDVDTQEYVIKKRGNA